jgi:hypothetical protein
MTAIEYLVERPSPGWFVFDVMRRNSSNWDWVALMVDVDPEDPRDYIPPPGGTARRERWMIIPGKHRNRDAAWDALEDMMTTRH